MVVVALPCLYLHKICSLIITLRTRLLNTVNVLPSSCAAQHVVHLLQLGVGPTGDALGDVVDVWAGGAGETEAGV